MRTTTTMRGRSFGVNCDESLLIRHDESRVTCRMSDASRMTCAHLSHGTRRDESLLTNH